MTAVRDNCDLAPSTAEATDFLIEMARKGRRKKPVRKPKAVALEIAYTVPDEVLAEAKRLAGKEQGRIRLEKDGSVIVFNSIEHKRSAKW